MAVDIFTELASAAMHFRVKTGADPENIYLGRRQHDALVQMIQNFRYDYPHSFNEHHPMMVHGMRVYKVDTENHFAIGVPANGR